MPFQCEFRGEKTVQNLLVQVDLVGITGVGTILSTPINKMKVSNTQLLTQITSQKDVPFVYYTGQHGTKRM